MEPGSYMKCHASYGSIHGCIKHLTREGGGRENWEFRIRAKSKTLTEVWRIK